MDGQTAIETAAEDAGVGLCIVIVSAFLGCLIPAKYQWKNLTEEEKFKFIVLSSFFIGTLDYIFDILVCVDWFISGDMIWASFIIIFVSLAGLISWYFRCCHLISSGAMHAAKFDNFNLSRKDWLLFPVFLIGFGSFVDAYAAVSSNFKNSGNIDLLISRMQEKIK